MSVLLTPFEQWLQTVQALLEKRGIDTSDLDIPFYHSLFRDGLDPEQTVMEDACLVR